ncbi:MAG: hypothetical protein L6R41_004385 [Letrouitia leprolyta]|nr:MAG: hypothetical protein L6R41_004385 [Letrouitia leprolyta]
MSVISKEQRSADISVMLYSSPRLINDVAPRPLLVDRVSQGRAAVSTSPFLTLPSELLASITEYLSSASLASLALVNYDCQQLARSHQFATTRLDYSDRSIQIINQLQAEVSERSQSDGVTKALPLGPYIRRLVIRTEPMFIKQRHGIDMDDEYQVLTDGQRERRQLAASYFYFDSYIASIQSLIAKGIGLPNLLYLDWLDRASLTPVFWDAVVNSTARYLKVRGAYTGRSFTTERANNQQSGFWPLQSLHLNISGIHCHELEDLSSFYASILHACGPTLESLTWHSFNSRDIRTDCISPIPRFPRLRQLQLIHVRFIDFTMLKELVHDGLSSLNIITYDSLTYSPFLASCGQISLLKTFFWQSEFLHETQFYQFLQSNPQIQKLNISGNVPLVYLEERILPLLTHEFHVLKSLSLQWEGNKIPEQSLAMISSLPTLEHLAMAALGRHFWLQNQWIIDHKALQRHLSNLQRLRKLMFRHDRYDTSTPHGGDRYHDIDDCIQIEEKRRHLLLGHATEYVKLLPNLDWIHLGGLSMIIKHELKHDTSTAQPLIVEDDDSFTVYNQLFGCKGI